MSTKQGTFSFGVSNIVPSKENIKLIEKAIEDTIKQVHKEGISEDKLEAQLHSIELQVKKTREHWGLGTISNMLSYTIHDGNPLDVFKLNEFLQKIRADYKNNLFSKLIEKYFLSNPHKLVIQMLPDSLKAENDKMKEKIMLKSIEDRMKDDDKQKLIHEAIELKKDQESIQDPDQLPGLSLSDIPSKIEAIEHTRSNIGEVPVYWFEQPTNGITHIRVKLNLSHVPAELRELIPMYCQFLPEVGTKNYDYKKFHTLMQTRTSGIDIQNDKYSLTAAVDDSQQNLIISVSFLDRNIDKAMTYLSEILSTPNFDDTVHLADMIKTTSVDIANNIGNNSLQYGMSYASAGLKQFARNNEKLSSDIFLCQMGAEVLNTSNPKNIYNDLIVNLTDLASHVMREENISFAVTGDKKKFKLVDLKLQMIHNAIINENSRAQEKLNHLPVGGNSDFKQLFYQNYFETPLNVNNCVESFIGPGYYSKDYGTALVTANLLTHEFLHPLIREKGGAYGSGCSANENGTFNFYSFWDPKLDATYNNFEKSIQHVCDMEFDDKQLEQAKLATFQKFDKVLEPSLKGMLHFTRGYTDEDRSNHRITALDCNKELVSDMAKTIMAQLEKGNSSRVVFGAQLNEDDEIRSNGWKVEKPLEFLSSSYFDKYNKPTQL